MRVHAYFTRRLTGVQKLLQALQSRCSCRKQNSPSATRTCLSSLLQSCWVWAAPAQAEHGWVMLCHAPERKRKLGHESQQECLHTAKLNVFLRKSQNSQPWFGQINATEGSADTFKKLTTFYKEWLNHAIFREKAITVLGGVQLIPMKAGEKPRARAASPVQWLRDAAFCSLLWKLIFTLFYTRWKSDAISFHLFPGSWFCKAKAELPWMTLMLKHVHKYFAESGPLKV